LMFTRKSPEVAAGRAPAGAKYQWVLLARG
jgi:hypothetical protein